MSESARTGSSILWTGSGPLPSTLMTIVSPWVKPVRLVTVPGWVKKLGATEKTATLDCLH
jgi:hypothetical protein